MIKFACRSFLVLLTFFTAVIISEVVAQKPSFGNAESTRAKAFAPTAELVTNGSFETGDFSGWTATNAASPYLPWRVSSIFDTGAPPNVPTSPQDGTKDAWNGLASTGGSTFKLTQDVTIPAANSATFTWKDRLQMDLVNFCGGAGQPTCGDVVYAVEILDTSNNILQPLTTVVASGGAFKDTGWQSHTTSLNAYAGQTIRLRFISTATATLTGRGVLEIDAVSVQSTPLPPSASITLPATLITGTTATISGLGNPNGFSTTGWFRYSDTYPGHCDDTFGTRTPVANLGSGNGNVLYPQSLTGLTRLKTYYYCAITQNASGTSFGSLLNFRTGDLVVNGSFETGDFTGWTATNANNALFNWQVDGIGPPNLPASPQHGSVDAWNGLASAAGSNFKLTQDVSIPAGSSFYLTWKDRLWKVGDYDFNCSGSGRSRVVYAVEILDTSNNILQPLTTVVAPEDIWTDTGWQSHSFPLTSFAGQTIRLRFISTQTSICRPFGVLEIDAVSIRPNGPTVSTNFVSTLTSSTTILRGTANPNGSSSTGWFRYSTTDPGMCSDSFGTRAPAAGGTVLGAGSSPVDYSELLTGLNPGTQYFYCAIAQSPEGTSFGDLFSLATAPIYTLSASVSGSGTGTVTSSPAGINCPGDCSEPFSPGTIVSFTATPTGNSVFTGWSGDCTGMGNCGLNITSTHSVTATFLSPGTLVSMSGRVTNATGRGITNANVTISGSSLPVARSTITNRNGTYSFNGLQPGQTYFVMVSARRFSFSPSNLTVNLYDTLTNVNIVAQP